MSQSKTFTVPSFGPNDLLTSDKIGERAVKVSIENLGEVGFLIATQLASLVEAQEQTLSQLKLLNARTEEAFETNIQEDDADVYSGH